MARIYKLDDGNVIEEDHHNIMAIRIDLPVTEIADVAEGEPGAGQQARNVFPFKMFSPFRSGRTHKKQFGSKNVSDSNGVSRSDRFRIKIFPSKSMC